MGKVCRPAAELLRMRKERRHGRQHRHLDGPELGQGRPRLGQARARGLLGGVVRPLQGHGPRPRGGGRAVRRPRPRGQAQRRRERAGPLRVRDHRHAHAHRLQGRQGRRAARRQDEQGPAGEVAGRPPAEPSRREPVAGDNPGKVTLQPGRCLGPYEVVAALGAGGMGEVYRARDTRLGRDVALKVLPVALADDADRRRRFEGEARAVAALNHPAVLALYDVGEADGVAFLVTELLEGETLRARATFPCRKRSAWLLKKFRKSADWWYRNMLREET